MAARRRRASDAGQTLCSTDSHGLFRSLHLSTWLSLETLTLGAGNLGIPAFREPLKHSLALTQTSPPPPPWRTKKALPFPVLQPLSIHNGAGIVRVYCTIPLVWYRKPERLLLLLLPSVPPETMTTMSSFPQWESSIPMVEPRMLYWARVEKLIKYCQLSDTDNQPCLGTLVTPAWPCSFVSHYGLNTCCREVT